MIRKVMSTNREEWKSLRAKYIGGSDAAAVVGLNPYCSPFALWAEKTGKTPPFDGNLMTDVGTYLEEFIARKFAEITDKKVRRVNQSFLNDRYPWAIANIDRDIVGEDSGLECKSTSSLNNRKFKNGEFPDRYYCQCVHYLAVTEKIRWYLAVLIGNSQFLIYQLTRLENDVKPDWCVSSVYVSQEEIDALMHAEKVFFEENIQKNHPPRVDGTRSSTDALTAVFSDTNIETIDLNAYDSLLREYMNYSQSIKEIELYRDQVANQIKALLGNAEQGESVMYRVSWIKSERKSFDAKRYASEHGYIDLSGYYKISNIRTFKVTELQKND